MPELREQLEELDSRFEVLFEQLEFAVAGAGRRPVQGLPLVAVIGAVAKREILVCGAEQVVFVILVVNDIVVETVADLRRPGACC